jgi:uncharacterized protein YecE (DUF72 family)
VIRVGPAGWSYRDWEGTVYPCRRQRGFHPLRYLSKYFTCVEINSTFYATPRADYAELWAAQIADRSTFLFSVKLQDVFTHEPLSADGRELDHQVRAFLDGIEPLRRTGRLACLLLQFPLSFHRATRNEARLELLERLFGHLPLVLEVRHRSWFETESLGKIERMGYSLAHIDLPDAADHPPSEAPQVGTIGYLRLHGRNRTSWFDPHAGRDRRYDYLYDPQEIDELVQKAQRISQGLGDTFVITNNHFGGKAVANALEILAGLEGKRVPAPPEVLEAFPRLGATVEADGERGLF